MAQAMDPKWALSDQGSQFAVSMPESDAKSEATICNDGCGGGGRQDGCDDASSGWGLLDLRLW